MCVYNKVILYFSPRYFNYISSLISQGMSIINAKRRPSDIFTCNSVFIRTILEIPSRPVQKELKEPFTDI